MGGSAEEHAATKSRKMIRCIMMGILECQNLFAGKYVFRGRFLLFPFSSTTRQPCAIYIRNACIAVKKESIIASRPSACISFLTIANVFTRGSFPSLFG